VLSLTLSARPILQQPLQRVHHIRNERVRAFLQRCERRSSLDEQRRSRRLQSAIRAELSKAIRQSAIRSERSEQSNPGLCAAVLRRREERRSSSAIDDEVGGFQSAIRGERSEQSNTEYAVAGDRGLSPAE
jgi:hypothetical protein